ncbi:MAG: YdcF family protein [Verrucomicrobia bacterium]|nr:YdcF family protein [Verrucomicrobiota bacterium]
MKKRWAKMLLGCAAAAVLLAGLGFAFPQWFLCVENREVRADILIVPGGAGGERARWAAQLYTNGIAPKILLTGAGDYHGHRAILMAAGVPRDAILIESKSATTRENAEFSARLLREQGIRTAVVVTSWYHSRRALAAFEHFAPDIRFYSRPSHYAYARADWKKAGIGRYVWDEYLKLAGYWMRHGIAPF